MLRRTVLLPLVAVLALTACNDTKETVEPEAGGTPEVSASATVSAEAEVNVTASHETAGGAMNGLLEAMRSGDNAAVRTWLSPVPESDRASVVQVERLQGMMGLDGKVFWLVDERKVVGVEESGDTAEVELDGYIVWCTGTGPDDEKASCAQPNGAANEQSTKYDAVKVEGEWYVRLDLNRGELIDDNPGAEGVSA
jgi:hypothetical protein